VLKTGPTALACHAPPSRATSPWEPGASAYVLAAACDVLARGRLDGFYERS
jgi:hypothetical protein